MSTRHLSTAALLASALVLTACGGDGSDTASSPSTGSTSAAAQANDADLAFLEGMTPHHEQAVEMSDLVLAANPPAEVAAIANEIKAAQAPEIEQMDMMLSELGQAGGDMAPGGEHGGGHGGDMAEHGGDMAEHGGDMAEHGGDMAEHGGMMSEDMMAELGGATGADAARLYLEGMIRHHQGAIEASDAQLEEGMYEPALTLAQEIKQAQESEISTMQALLQTL